MTQDYLSTIGRKLKQERLKQNTTLQQIAEQSGLSKGLISKIENSRTIPSMPVFFSILKAMGISPAQFFEGVEGEEPQAYTHIKPQQQQPILKENRPGFHYRWIMSQQLGDMNMEVVLLELAPGVKGSATATDGYELKYLLKGKVAYCLEEQVIVLEAGDTLFFDASKPHRPENLLPTPALMLVVYLIAAKR